MKSAFQNKTWKTAFFLFLGLVTGPKVFGQYCGTSLDCYEYISEVAFGEITNISACGSGYSDFTAQSTTVQRGESYQLAVTIESDEKDYIYAFVDWNQDGRLNDDGEVYVVAEHVNESARYAVFIDVPADAALGETRMRVMVDYDNDEPDPCTNGWGEAEDYTLSVADNPACPSPKDIGVNILSSSSAELTWTSAAADFEIKWGTSGFDMESEGTLEDGVTATDYPLTGLTEGMTYDVYIRQYCDAEGYSRWAGPFTFTSVLTDTITYTGGDIPTGLNEALDMESAICEPEATLTVNVPPGYRLSNLTVRYNMVARRNAWMKEQASMLYSPTLARGEEGLSMGQGDEEGTYEYERSVTFANGATGSVNFVLRAWRTWGGGESCGTYYSYVQNGTWQLIPTFGRLPSCTAPSGLVIDGVSRQGATISWMDTGGDPPEGYEYYYSTGAAVPSAAATPSGSTAVRTANLSGLTAGQTYYFWVRSKCGENDYSSWSPAIIFSTGDIHYVKEGGWGDGSSWADAAGNLQDMITVSNAGDEIWVAAGVYESPPYAFSMKEGVAVYGGFPAGGGDETEREWRENETILTASPGSDRPVIYNDMLSGSAVLDGFIIQGGSTSSGGGIFNEEASPTLHNLWIRNNHAAWGGGIFNTRGSSPELVDVIISNNTAEYSGGGMSNDEDANPTLTRVVIKDNRVTGVTITGDNTGGAGIHHQGGGTLNLKEVIIEGNSSGNNGGGIFLAGESALLIKNSLIVRNSAEGGGGVYLAAGSMEAMLINTAIGDNEAQQGGGVYNDGIAILANTTVGANRAAMGGGIYNAQEVSTLIAQNSIISGNHKIDRPDADDIHNGSIAGSIQQYNNSLVAGSGGSGVSWDGDYGTDGGGNLDGGADYLSTDSHAADFLRPAGCSPAIDAGDNSLYEALDGDLASDVDAGGNPRLGGSFIDMGAFERQLPPSNRLTGPSPGIYKIGDHLVFEVGYPVDVTVSGIPYIPVIIGDKRREARFESGSGSNILTFQYQIMAGDEAAEGIQVNPAIVLDGGTIQYLDSGSDTGLSLCGGVVEGVLVDGIEPKLTAASVFSDNALDIALARPADRITLIFTASETISEPTVTIAGRAADVHMGEGMNEWKAVLTLTEADREGTISLAINYMDLSGNEGIAVYTTMDGSEVFFDKTPPDSPVSLAVERADGKLVVRWESNAEPDFGIYRLYFGVRENRLNDHIDVNDIDTEMHIHTDLINGTAYYYQMVAIDRAGNESEASPVVNEVPKATQTITFDKLKDMTYGDEPFELAVMASSGLPVRIVSSSPEVAEIARDGSTLVIHKAGVATLTATQPGNPAFEPAAAVQQELVVAKAKPVISWSNPMAITYGAALNTAQLNAVSDITGALTYTPEAGTVLNAGTGQLLEVMLVPDDVDNYEIVMAEVHIDVGKATAIIIANEVQTHTYDGRIKKVTATLNHDERVLIYNDPKHYTDAGSYNVTITSDESPNYTSASKTIKLVIDKADIKGTIFTDKSFAYDGKAKSLTIGGRLPEGVTVSYGNNNRTDVGSQGVTATVDGGANYGDLLLTATLTVTPAERTLDFPAFPDKTYGDADFSGGATASSGEAITYTSDNPAVAEITEGGMVRITGAGEAVITATVPENGNYTGRPQVSRTLAVHRAVQVITFNAPAEVDRDAGGIQLDVGSSSGLPVTLRVDDGQVATLDGTTLNIHRLGTINITATQAGDGNHGAAEPVTVTVRVVDPTSDFAVRVHPAVSPNGDGINEFLMVEGIKDFPENRVTVFSRNGTVVWEATGYDNSQTVFRGTGAGGLNIAPGTYFYIVEVKVNGRWEHRKGYFVLRY